MLIIHSSHFPFPPQPSVIVSCHHTFIETACVKLITGFLFSKVNSCPVLKWLPFLTSFFTQMVLPRGSTPSQAISSLSTLTHSLSFHSLSFFLIYAFSVSFPWIQLSFIWWWLFSLLLASHFCLLSFPAWVSGMELVLHDRLLLLLLYVTRQIVASLLCSDTGPCDRLTANGIWVSLTQIRLLSFLVPAALHGPLRSSSSLTMLEDGKAWDPPASNSRSTFVRMKNTVVLDAWELGVSVTAVRLSWLLWHLQNESQALPQNKFPISGNGTPTHPNQEL